MSSGSQPLVSPSLRRRLQPGERLAVTAYERGKRQWTTQRLGDEVWWAEVRNYQATVVVADQGVLLFDPLADGRAEGLLAAIAAITDLPLRTLVYSHHHADHIGDASRIAEASPGLEIVATPACAEAIELHEVDAPPPTRLLDGPSGSFEWGGIEVRYGPLPGHCPDNSWFLLPAAATLHCVDMVHPGGLEFEAFGLADDLWLYERSLAQLDRLDWTFLVAGHREIGFREDVALVGRYLEELRRHTEDVAAGLPAGRYASPHRPPHSWAPTRRREVVEAVVARMAPGWRHWPEFDEVAASHASAMFSDVEYRGSGGARRRRADP